jgi:hypothetical protein
VAAVLWMQIFGQPPTDLVEDEAAMGCQRDIS